MARRRGGARAGSTRARLAVHVTTAVESVRHFSCGRAVAPERVLVLMRCLGTPVLERLFVLTTLVRFLDQGLPGFKDAGVDELPHRLRPLDDLLHGDLVGAVGVPHPAESEIRRKIWRASAAPLPPLGFRTRAPTWRPSPRADWR